MFNDSIAAVVIHGGFFMRSTDGLKRAVCGLVDVIRIHDPAFLSLSRGGN